MLSITAWRFVPLPDIRTVRGVGWEVILGGSGRIEGGWREYQVSLKSIEFMDVKMR